MRSAQATLGAVLLVLLTGCATPNEPGDPSTPAGGLTRELYLAANERWDDLCRLYGVTDAEVAGCAVRAKYQFSTMNLVGVPKYLDATGWQLTSGPTGAVSLQSDHLATVSGLAWRNGYSIGPNTLKRFDGGWLLDLA